VAKEHGYCELNWLIGAYAARTACLSSKQGEAIFAYCQKSAPARRGAAASI